MRWRLIGNWRKGNYYYRVSETLATLLPVVVWKVEKVPNEMGGPAQEISNQRIVSDTWFLLAAYFKMWGERDQLTEGLVNQISHDTIFLRNSQPCKMVGGDKMKKWLPCKDQIPGKYGSRMKLRMWQSNLLLRLQKCQRWCLRVVFTQTKGILKGSRVCRIVPLNEATGFLGDLRLWPLILSVEACDREGLLLKKSVGLAFV